MKPWKFWIVERWDGERWVKVDEALDRETGERILKQAAIDYSCRARLLDPLLKVVAESRAC